jgi:hypothetical protein
MFVPLCTTPAAPTYAYQDKLPSLPVPPLDETLAKYLRSLQPFEMLGAPSFPYTRTRLDCGLTPFPLVAARRCGAQASSRRRR